MNRPQGEDQRIGVRAQTEVEIEEAANLQRRSAAGQFHHVRVRIVRVGSR